MEEKVSAVVWLFLTQESFMFVTWDLKDQKEGG